MAANIITVVGARPQFIKAAAVSRVIKATPGLSEKILHTGQHFDDNMSGSFFRDLEIPEPAFHLQISGGNHGHMTGRMLEAIETVLLAERPDAVLIYGDTNSTLAGAIAAVKQHIPVVHVEAGLRSFNMRMPEEVNRVLSDRVSALLLCPTEAAIGNLAREGIVAGVHNVGDVMYDAALHAKERSISASDILAELGLEAGSYSLATIHRAENTADAASLGRVMAYLEEQAAGQQIVLPVHPRTRSAIREHGIALRRIRPIDPVGYFDMHRLLAGAAMVFTDSGGLQKEAYFHRKSCVTLRDETEWVETVANGWNRLWSVAEYAPRREIADYGDGHAAERVVEEIAKFLKVG